MKEFTIKLNPPIYKSVMRDLGIDPLAPFHGYRAYQDLARLEINIVPRVDPIWFGFEWST